MANTGRRERNCILVLFEGWKAYSKLEEVGGRFLLDANQQCVLARRRT